MCCLHLARNVVAQTPYSKSTVVLVVGDMLLNTGGSVTGLMHKVRWISWT